MNAIEHTPDALVFKNKNADCVASLSYIDRPSNTESPEELALMQRVMETIKADMH